MATKKITNKNRTRLSRIFFEIESRANEILGEKGGVDASTIYLPETIKLLYKGMDSLHSSIIAKRVADGTIPAGMADMDITELASYVQIIRVGIEEGDLGSLSGPEHLAVLALIMLGGISEEFLWPERDGGFVKLARAMEVVGVADFGIEAMSAVCEAERMLDANQGTRANEIGGIEVEIVRRMAERARRAADVKHIENRELKAQAFAWCDLNMVPGKTIDDGAMELEKIIPVKLSTRRTYISQWRKKQSASRL